jgi:hypothetical protein
MRQWTNTRKVFPRKGAKEDLRKSKGFSLRLCAFAGEILISFSIALALVHNLFTV